MSESDNLQLIFESSQMGMLVLNEEGVILKVNKTVLKLFNKTYEEVLGKGFGDLIQCLGSFEDERGCGYGEMCQYCEFRKSAFVAIEDKKITKSLEFRKTVLCEGKYTDMWFRSSLTPININSRHNVFVSLVDITDAKINELTAIKSMQDAEIANRAKSEFLANMSHEIRTPINGIVGMIDLTLLTALSNEQRENLITAKSCANSLLHIINDILDFSKLEANKLVIESIGFDIRSLVEETVKAHTSMANNKGLKLNYSFSSRIPQFVTGDPHRIQQVLHNLISNAIKFTEKGNVSVIVRNNHTTTENGLLEFIVSDTGIGILDEDRNKLFKSFSQVDGTITRKYGGTGLGLVISKQLVEMMGGTIWVESEKGKGSHFCFNVKLNKSDKPNHNRAPSLPINKSIKSMKILLAEDDKVSQLVISRMLREKGHVVDIANNGMEALKLHGLREYDSILMDIHMPDMDGIEATKRIREKEGHKRHTPIIALTAYALHGDRERFLALGMDEYLSKPVKMEELFWMLDRVLEEKFHNQDDFFEGIRLGDNGELIFINERRAQEKEKILPVVNDISVLIPVLEDNIAQCDLMAMEATAHSIKELANQIDAEELKGAAFKLELSARRGNLSEAVQYAMQIRYEFTLYKKV